MEAIIQTLHERVHANSPLVLTALGACALFLSIYSRPNLSHIPTAGSNGLLAYYDSFRCILGAKSILEEGCRKFRQSGIFKVAFPGRWIVMVTSPALIDELRSAKDDEVLFIDEVVAWYILGLSSKSIPYHVDTVRTPLTKNIPAKFGEIYDEITQSLENLIPAGDEWQAVSALSIGQKTISRASNRLFFGDLVSKHPEWIDFNIKFSTDCLLRGIFVGWFPRFLRPLLGTILSPVRNAMNICRPIFANEIAQRLELEAEYGKDYDGRPNDLISWLLDLAPPEERTIDNILRRILAVSMTAIDATSFGFYRALLNLAAYPEYADPMREEVLSAVKEHGWTKAALNNMHKVDSFLRESLRHNGMPALVVHRRVVKKGGYTFSNGLHLPYGTWVNIPPAAIYFDEKQFENPLEFDGFRFSKLRDVDDKGKHQMVSVNLQHMSFGFGRHACPGRYFAVSELKTMLAHLLVTYDMKPGGEPESSWFGSSGIAPDPNVKVLFKRRVADY